MPEFNKEIQKLKLALTSDCALRCRHCFIDKGLGLTMSFGDAARAVDLFLSSPGERKRLELYGGEPFLRYQLLKEIVAYARKANGKARKKLFITVATSAVPLDGEKLAWLRENGVGLAISFSGGREAHDHTRVFPGGAGSYGAVRRKSALAAEALAGKSLVALYCVHPQKAGTVLGDFKKVVKAGFRVVDVECVHGHGWTEESFALFRDGLEKVLRHIERGIRAGDFVFLETFLDMLVCSGSRGKFSCPLYRDLELYPDGSYSLYPFGFVDYRRYIGRIRIGAARRGLRKRFRDCSFPSKACGSCVAGYYVIGGLSDGHAPYAYRTRRVEAFFKELLKKSSSDGRYFAYVKAVYGMVEAAYGG